MHQTLPPLMAFVLALSALFVPLAGELFGWVLLSGVLRAKRKPSTTLISATRTRLAIVWTRELEAVDASTNSSLAPRAATLIFSSSSESSLAQIILPTNWVCDKHWFLVRDNPVVDREEWSQSVVQAAVDDLAMRGAISKDDFYKLSELFPRYAPLCCYLGNERMTDITLKHSKHIS